MKTFMLLFYILHTVQSKKMDDYNNKQDQESVYLTLLKMCGVSLAERQRNYE